MFWWACNWLQMVYVRSLRGETWNTEIILWVGFWFGVFFHKCFWMTLQVSLYKRSLSLLLGRNCAQSKGLLGETTFPLILLLHIWVYLVRLLSCPWSTWSILSLIYPIYCSLTGSTVKWLFSVLGWASRYLHNFLGKLFRGHCIMYTLFPLRCSLVCVIWFEMCVQ